MRVRWYVAVLVGVPLLAAAPPVLLVRDARLSAYDPSIYGSLMEFGYNSEGRNDDVVIFGDSSALFGVSPRLLGERLGLTAVNLPQSIGSLTVVNDMMLEHYLAHNRRPKVIVLYFTAWDLNYSHNAREGFLFEGQEMLLRHGSWAQRGRFAWQHPVEVGLFPFRYYRAMANAWPFHPEVRRAHDAGLRASAGHLDDDAHVGVLTGDCEMPDWLTVNVGDATVRELRAKYEAMGLKVVVYLAPVPACRGVEEVTGRSFAGVGAKGPVALGPGDFVDDTSYAHMTPASVAEATGALGDVVAAALK